MTSLKSLDSWALALRPGSASRIPQCITQIVPFSMGAMRKSWCRRALGHLARNSSIQHENLTHTHTIIFLQKTELPINLWFSPIQVPDTRLHILHLLCKCDLNQLNLLRGWYSEKQSGVKTSSKTTLVQLSCNMLSEGSGSIAAMRMHIAGLQLQEMWLLKGSTCCLWNPWLCSLLTGGLCRTDLGLIKGAADPSQSQPRMVSPNLPALFHLESSGSPCLPYCLPIFPSRHCLE